MRSLHKLKPMCMSTPIYGGGSLDVRIMPPPSSSFEVPWFLNLVPSFLSYTPWYWRKSQCLQSKLMTFRLIQRAGLGLVKRRRCQYRRIAFQRIYDVLFTYPAYSSMVVTVDAARCMRVTNLSMY